MMWDAPERLQMSDEARRTLQGWLQAGTSPQRVVVRARIVLLAADGLANRRIALVGPASALPPALHADLGLVAQPRRALVPRTDRQTHPPRGLYQRAGVNCDHQRVHHHQQ